MNKKMPKWVGVVVFALAVSSILFLLFYPWHIVLRITALKTSQVVLCARMDEGEEFIFSFIHSVNKRPVYETLRVFKDHLLIVKSRFDSFGAGMPENSTPEGSLKVGSDGWLEWTVNRPVPEVKIFVGWVSNLTLRLRGREIVLTSLVEPGTSLSIQAQKSSYYEIWKSRCIR
jgi:hypothetical protein